MPRQAGSRRPDRGMVHLHAVLVVAAAVVLAVLVALALAQSFGRLS
jgi:hypothetical protein